MPRADWLALSTPYGDAVRGYHARRGHDPQAASVAVTVRTNTELVPKRGDNLIQLIREMTDLDGAEGSRVMEVGCGFGALASYLTWKGRPASLIGVDNREEFVEMASECARAMELEPVLSFAHADMRELSRLPVRNQDLLIVNNAFIYLTTPSHMDRALSEFAAVTRPGGWVLFFHANKWRWREPFTKDPAVHLLPPRVARVATRTLGWQHNHGRVRLLSPVELRRRVRRAGWEDIQIVGFAKERSRSGIRRYVAPYYALAARRASTG